MVVMRKQVSAAFKAQVVLEILKEERTVNEIAAANGVHPTQLTRWKGQVVDGLPHACPGAPRCRSCPGGLAGHARSDTRHPILKGGPIA